MSEYIPEEDLIDLKEIIFTPRQIQKVLTRLQKNLSFMLISAPLSLMATGIFATTEYLLSHDGATTLFSGGALLAASILKTLTCAHVRNAERKTRDFLSNSYSKRVIAKDEVIPSYIDINEIQKINSPFGFHRFTDYAYASGFMTLCLTAFNTFAVLGTHGGQFTETARNETIAGNAILLAMTVSDYYLGLHEGKIFVEILDSSPTLDDLPTE